MALRLLHHVMGHDHQGSVLVRQCPATGEHSDEAIRPLIVIVAGAGRLGLPSLAFLPSKNRNNIHSLGPPQAPPHPADGSDRDDQRCGSSVPGCSGASLAEPCRYPRRAPDFANQQGIFFRHSATAPTPRPWLGRPAPSGIFDASGCCKEITAIGAPLGDGQVGV
jgi:hypothetical protein